MIFSIRDSGVVAAEAGLDLSSEVMKRFDAATRRLRPPNRRLPLRRRQRLLRSSFADGFRVLGLPFSVELTVGLP